MTAALGMFPVPLVHSIARVIDFAVFWSKEAQSTPLGEGGPTVLNVDGHPKAESY